MKEYKYQAILWRCGHQYRCKFFAESKQLAHDHAKQIARFGAYDVICVKRLPSNADIEDAGKVLSCSDFPIMQ